MFQLHLGDCEQTMLGMESNSVDAIVCDPPYELGFMGKSWDASGIAYSVPMWAQALRVLKPGGHLLAFSGSRTYHRMVCAIEDAGFEIRDQIMWVYGSGFPKSLDVSKAIDKARTEDLAPLRVVCRAVRAAMDARGQSSRDLVTHFGGCNPRLIDHWAARDTDSQPSLPTPEQWSGLRSLFPEISAHDAEVERLNGRKGTAGEAWQTADVLGEHERATPGFVGMRFDAVDRSIREPSEAARQWQGWGTALKPAHEPIVVARKPLIGTVAANVLAHGTGAINVDGCRVEHSGAADLATSLSKKPGRDDVVSSGVYGAGRPQQSVNTAGRWPANLIHDGSDEVVAAFPNDAARFYYAAKASKSDRNVGLDTPPGTLLSHGSTLRDAENLPKVGNVHPTVKPTDLMRYLVRLVTPPGGIVLDPFTGSGSTGRAAMLEGFRFIGCELSPEYLAIADARIGAAACGGFA